MKKEQSRLSILRTPLLTAIAAVILFCFFSGVSQLEEGQREEGKRQLETALRRAAVACYAAEGAYPQDLAYLTENYGVQVDEERFTVFYDIFGSNMMPDITVLENES